MASTTPDSITDDDRQHISGTEATVLNITAGVVTADTIRSTLGPVGMSKMVVDDLGNVLVTDDGSNILEQIDIEHPTAQLIKEIADSQEESAGDGTTSAVVLASEMLKEAEDLLANGLHPTTVIAGYQKAAAKARDIYTETARPVDFENRAQLRNAVTSVIGGDSKEDGDAALVDVILQSLEPVLDGEQPNVDNIHFVTKAGEPVDASEAFPGMVLNRDPLHSEMPDRVENAAIALLDTGLEADELSGEMTISPETPSANTEFQEREKQSFARKAQTLSELGATVVVTSEGIHDQVQHELATRGILAVRRPPDSAMQKLARATGANIVTNVAGMSVTDLGTAGVVTQEKVAGDNMLFVRDCDVAETSTILLRGGTKQSVNETERRVKNALGAIGTLIDEPSLLPGGGGPETKAALALRKYADGVDGREQLAVDSFADALEIIPRTLATNAGFNAIDAVTKLRNTYATANDTTGLSLETGEPAEMMVEGIVDPLAVRTGALMKAVEVTVLVLRIDGIISAAGTIE